MLNNIRLETCLNLIDKTNCFMDVGCDHGYLSLGLVRAEKAKKVICADISEKCLAKAKTLLKNYSNVEFLLSDGFKNVDTLPDSAAILGMGGREIVKILSDAKDSSDKSGKNDVVKTLYVSPQTGEDLVRIYLTKNSYKIVEDVIVSENGKFYNIIKAVYLKNLVQNAPTDAQSKYGMFYNIKNSILKEKIIKDKAAVLSYKQTDENLKKLEIITEVEKWQQ